MELMGLIIFSCGIMILWKYKTDSLWVIALLALTVGLASFFELQKKAPKQLKCLGRAQKRTPPASARTDGPHDPPRPHARARKSRIISWAALWPGAPLTPPPGWVEAPHMYKPGIGER